MVKRTSKQKEKLSTRTSKEKKTIPAGPGGG